MTIAHRRTRLSGLLSFRSAANNKRVFRSDLAVSSFECTPRRKTGRECEANAFGVCARLPATVNAKANAQPLERNVRFAQSKVNLLLPCAFIVKCFVVRLRNGTLKIAVGSRVLVLKLWRTTFVVPAYLMLGRLKKD